MRETILFLDILFGGAVWQETATHLARRSDRLVAAVPGFTPPALPTLDAQTLSDAAKESLEERFSGASSTVDVVVANDISAAAAAWLIVKGWARRGVLVDPTLMGSELWLPGLLRTADVDLEAAMAAAERYAAFESELESGQWSDSLIDATFGVPMGGPVSVAMASIAKREFARRMPFVAPPSGDGPEPSDLGAWLPAWRTESALSVWLTRPPEQQRALLQEFAPDAELRVLDVDRRPWLSAPDVVARELIG